MEEILLQIILQALYDALKKAIESKIDYEIRKAVDVFGNYVTQIVQEVDTDGDGITDSEVVLHTMDIVIPDLSNGYCICDKGQEIGIGFPEFEVIDGREIQQYTGMWETFSTPRITGNGGGYLLDMDGDDKQDETVIPLDDMNGDGIPEWGWVTDDDDNGVPDASRNAPFYPVGSDEYMSVIQKDSNVPSIIVMSPDGTMSVYDTNGQITAENCDTAYSLWVADNGIMNKQLDNYSVTEGLLLCVLLMGGFFFVKSLFKRKDVYK